MTEFFVLDDLYAIWMYQTVKAPLKYCPLWKRDSDRLEAIYRDNSSSKLSSEVYVYDSRYFVNIESRIMKATYYDDTERNIIRATWFYAGTNNDHQPFKEHEAGHLEEWYRSICQQIQHGNLESLTTELILREDEPVVQLVWTAKDPKKADSSTKSLMRISRDGREVCRGWLGLYKSSDPFNEGTHIAPLDTGIDDNLESNPIQVVFVVHGIGQSFLNRSDVSGKTYSFRQNVACFKHHVNAQLAKLSSSSSFNSSGVRSRIDVIPIEWYDVIHSKDRSLTTTVESMSLSTIPIMRTIANDVVFDVLVYQTQEYARIIQDYVIDRMNEAYDKYHRHFPDVPVSLFGHSLGTVIVHDCLLHHFNHIHFRPSYYFALGSPLGLFIAIRNEPIDRGFHYPTNTLFFNIFHPFDPIVYRIEPYIHSSLKTLDPQVVPHCNSTSGYRLHYAIPQTIAYGKKVALTSLTGIASSSINFLSSLSSSFPPLSSQINTISSNLSQLVKPTTSDGIPIESPSSIIASCQWCNGQRIDYSLQETSLETVNHYVSALASHLCYFDHADVGMFVAVTIVSGGVIPT